MGLHESVEKESAALDRHSSFAVSLTPIRLYFRYFPTKTSPLKTIVTMVDKWRGKVGLDDNFGWVVLVASCTFFVNLMQMAMIGRRRRIDKVPLPHMHDEDKPKFNGAQRAHQNTLEQVPFFFITLIMAGLRHPEEAAGLGAGWIVARIVYSLGYWTGVPKYRFPGFLLTMAIQLSPIGFGISTAAGFLDWW